MHEKLPFHARLWYNEGAGEVEVTMPLIERRVE
jgi:hypothetical protein